ncbi:MAG: FAD-dependent oxidoreductase [Gracilibacteraceae bacterium]|jgi:fumarate reductase flavoprotein subunit|nr:FAD-dependent oxidoreductase [Gracilibacteraceae bacterium]
MSNEIVFDTQYDVVVVGSGGSGKSTAYTAAKEGGLSVAILEKMPETGGTSIFAEGQAAFESSEQIARGVPKEEGRHFPTKEEGFRRFMDYSHYRANPDVVRMFVNNAAETIDVFKSLGVVYTDVLAYAMNQPDELISFHRPEGLGAYCQEVLLKAIQNLDVDIFTSTRAERLLVKDGAVVGVVTVDSDGNTLNVGAKAVVLATGGFGNSIELLEKHSLLGANARFESPPVPTQNSGDGLNMALAVGAATYNLGVAQVGYTGRGKFASSQSGAAGLQPWLWVNRHAQRFTSEELGYSFANCGMTLARQPRTDSFSILDEDMLSYLEKEGSMIALGDFVPYKSKLTGLRDELELDLAKGETAWSGNTLEELAAAIGIDPQVFTATVARYNQFCADGCDPDFYKPANLLRPVRKAPFYAVNICAAVLITCSSLRVNGNLQVTDDTYKPIPGLYAVGNEASGLYGDAYALDVPGATNGFAHTSGRVAARYIIANVRKE